MLRQFEVGANAYEVSFGWVSPVQVVHVTEHFVSWKLLEPTGNVHLDNRRTRMTKANAGRILFATGAEVAKHYREQIKRLKDEIAEMERQSERATKFGRYLDSPPVGQI